MNTDEIIERHLSGKDIPALKKKLKLDPDGFIGEALEAQLKKVVNDEPPVVG